MAVPIPQPLWQECEIQIFHFLQQFHLRYGSSGPKGAPWDNIARLMGECFGEMYRTYAAPLLRSKYHIVNGQKIGLTPPEDIYRLMTPGHFKEVDLVWLHSFTAELPQSGLTLQGTTETIQSRLQLQSNQRVELQKCFVWLISWINHYSPFHWPAESKINCLILFETRMEETGDSSARRKYTNTEITTRLREGTVAKDQYIYTPEAVANWILLHIFDSVYGPKSDALIYYFSESQTDMIHFN